MSQDPIMSKQKTDNAQKNSKCRLCCDTDKTVNHIISECSTKRNTKLCTTG